MTPEEIKARTRQYLDATNSPDWENRLREFSPSPEAHDEAMSDKRPFREAFADYHFSVSDDDMIAENDRVAFWGKVSATHAGEFPHGALAGVQGTGKRLEWLEVHVVFYDEEGKVANHLLMVQDLARLQQLGVLPTPE